MTIRKFFEAQSPELPNTMVLAITCDNWEILRHVERLLDFLMSESDKLAKSESYTLAYTTQKNGVVTECVQQIVFDAKKQEGDA